MGLGTVHRLVGEQGCSLNWLRAAPASQAAQGASRQSLSTGVGGEGVKPNSTAGSLKEGNKRWEPPPPPCGKSGTSSPRPCLRSSKRSFNGLLGAQLFSNSFQRST